MDDDDYDYGWDVGWDYGWDEDLDAGNVQTSLLDPYDTPSLDEAPTGYYMDEDLTLTFDEQSGLYYDELLGVWWTPEGEISGLVPRSDEEMWGEESDLAPTDVPTEFDDPNGRSFLDGLGNFFKNILGGFGGGASGGGASGGGASGGGGSFGGGSGGGSSQVHKRAEQAKNNLTQAQSSGASAQQIAALRQQLAIAEAAAQRVSSAAGVNTILLAAIAVAGVYALSRNSKR